MRGDMLKGNISISRFTGAGNGVLITLDDELSGARMFQIIMTVEQFGEAVTGLGYVDCQYWIGNTGLAGYTLETKTISIPLGKHPTDYTDQEMTGILSPFEFNGWTARDGDFKNHHNYNPKTKTVRVVFSRHVKPEDK